MIIVKFHEEVEIFFDELTEILFDKEYFGFKDSAKLYVTELVQEIIRTIHNKHKRIAPEYFSKYSLNLQYTAYKRNKTTWYVFFHFANNTYYIRYIGNNHNVGQYLK